MSVEAPKTTVPETTPVIDNKPAEQSVDAPAGLPATDAPIVDTTQKTETATETPAVAPVTEEAKPVEEVKNDESVAETTPASEGTLGYKAPGFLKQFHFSKHFFWLNEEPLAADALTTYSRSEKTGVAQNAAWARESGKGVLYYTKRAEDKAQPAGLIPLADATNVVKEGLIAFSFKVGSHTHKFEASSVSERDSWVAALEKQIEESKSIKDEITGRDSYKKNLEEYSKSPFAAGPAVTSRSKSKEPKKSLDAATATATTAAAAPTATETKAEETPAAAPVVAPVSAPAVTEEKKKEQKERSQSRKRTSIFGSLLGKKEEDKAVEKQIKDEQKAEEKAEKEEKKEEKKVEAEIKKEEAKADHDASNATEATAAAAVAAAPLPVIPTDKKEEKEEVTADSPVEATTPTTEKKAKRGSVFGSLFKKGGLTSPTTEKSEKEVGPATPAKDDVPPVSETAPKLDEPIETKPIDTAAVTAPTGTTDTVETPKETPATTDATVPKSEKKGLLGFIKKSETKKEEPKEEKPVETSAVETPAAAPAATTTTTTTAEPLETSAKSDSEDRTPREKEKRRTSIFGGLKSKKKEETDATTNGTEPKREKSPLPSKIGGLFRKPSKAVKSEEPKTAAPVETKEETPTAVSEPAPATTTATPAVEETTPVAPATSEAVDSKIVGDVVPSDLTTHDKVTTAPEVKASA